jgi:phage terminase large subunit
VALTRSQRDRRILLQPAGVRWKRGSYGGPLWVTRGWWKREESWDKPEAPPPPAKVVAPRMPTVRKKKTLIAAESDAPTAAVAAVRSSHITMAHAAELAVRNIARWRASPITYVKEVFQATPDVWQGEFLEAVPLNQRLALKACKGPGKSCGMAWVVWWFMTCFTHPKILATSVTGDNLRDGLWAELAYWRNKSQMTQDLFEWQVERLYAREYPETWFASARTWSKQADKSQQANTLAGIHAKNTLIVLDESGSIPSGVVAAADATLSTHSADGVPEVHKIIQAGNPTQTEGPLWDACTRDRALWWVKEITGDPDAPDRSPRVSKEWAQSMIDTWGRDNPWVMVNVFGKFPPAQADKLLGVEAVNTAMRRNYVKEVWEDEPLVFGVDVARQGDDRSVIFGRQGRIAFRPWTFRNLDLMDLSSRVARLIDEHTPDAVFVDESGIGAGVVDRLIQLGYEIHPVGFGSKANDSKRFVNRRAEMWWNMADWVKAQGALPDLPDLVPELTGPSYWFTGSDKLQLESKDDLKERGLVSPDLADALALTFAVKVVSRRVQPWREDRPKDWDPYASMRAK